MRGSVCFPRYLSNFLELELYIQHGSKRGSGRAAEHTVELVQCDEIPEAEEAMGGLAGANCRLDCCGYEYGIAGFSPNQGYG